MRALLAICYKWPVEKSKVRKTVKVPTSLPVICT